jgi:hypothetical protein
MLGHRRNVKAPVGNIAIIFWAFIGVFCGVSLIAVVSEHVPLFQDYGAPIIVGSFVSPNPIMSAKHWYKLPHYLALFC